MLNEYTTAVSKPAISSMVPGVESRFKLNVVPGSLPAALRIAPPEMTGQAKRPQGLEPERFSGATYL